MPEVNNPAHLAATPGASLTIVGTPRASVLAAEVARLDRIVAQQAAATLAFFDVPADLRAALIKLS